MAINNEVWSIVLPFDTLLFKFWSNAQVNTLIDSLRSTTDFKLVEMLTPNKNKIDYFRDDILRETIMNLYTAPSLCDMFCQDIYQHSTGLNCVTAAGLRKRLSVEFAVRLGALDNNEFQQEVMNYSDYEIVRKNIGVLVFDCPHDESQLRSNAMRVLYENFYLYTTPVIEQPIENVPDNQQQQQQHRQQNEMAIVTFMIKQISRNTDCMVIFVDQRMANRWWDRADSLRRVLLRAVCWDFKIKILIVSLCPDADDTVKAIFRQLINLKPVGVMYHQLAMAPTGGLISLVEQSCKLHVKDTFLKYCLRAWSLFRTIDTRDVDEESEVGSLVQAV